MLKFMRNESGSSSIEFVLWIPFIFTFILIAADASMAFMRQSQVWQVSRETARIVSRYGMDETQAEAFATANATIGTTPPAAVDVSFNNGDVIVTIAISSDVLAPFGIITAVTSNFYVTRGTHAMEPLT